MKTFGIDVSAWQKGFDFAKAKAEGAKFAILRGAYSCPAIESNGGKDTEFESHYKKAKAQGLSVGVYQYSMARTVQQAKQEAKFLFDNVLKGKQFELPIYIDVEDACQKKLGKRLLTDIVKTWCEYLEPKKFFVGIYASKSFFDEYLFDAELKRYNHWVAQWANECTYENKSIMGMWQFGGSTNAIRSNTVAGVTCDQNYMLSDFASVIKSEGLNGFTVKPKETVYTVVAGDTLSAIAEKYGTTYQKLAEYNGIANPNVIAVGQQIKIPNGAAKAKTAIKAGDTVRVVNPVAYGTNTRFQLWHDKYIVYEINGDRAVIGVNGVITAAIAVGNIEKV